MAISNHERVGKALELLKAGLGPFAEREFASGYGASYEERAQQFLADDRINSTKPIVEWDSQALLKLMWTEWNDVYRRTLGQNERSLVSELRTIRNQWAHQEKFSGDDADRALDSISRLLSAVSAPEADEVNRMKMELRRLIFEEQTRSGSPHRSRSKARQLETSLRGARLLLRTATSPRVATSRRSSPLTSGRFTSAKGQTSTAIPRSSSAVRI